MRRWSRLAAVMACVVPSGAAAQPASPDAMPGELVAALDQDCRAGVEDACPALRHVVTSIRSADRATAACRVGDARSCDAANRLRLALRFAALDWQMQPGGSGSGMDAGGSVLLPPGAALAPAAPLGPVLTGDLSPEADAPGAPSDGAALDAWLGR